MQGLCPAIRIENLRKLYGDKAAVDGLTLAVPRGCFFGFLGPNGAGKTTTIGLVPDESLLFDRLTGPEFLEFVGRMYDLGKPVAKERARELLSLFELSGEERKLIADYSKGMRKRLAMAAALIHRPELFLMDEPFEGVDAVGARLMKDLLLDQVRQGATVFLTSHVLEVVERLCDRVAIIHEGKLVMEEAMRDLRHGPETLEDIFVRLVGAERAVEKLDWL
jgi:ABC-2 type transport system ATP-binding protein